MLILSFVNTLANNSGFNKRTAGRNAIGGSIMVSSEMPGREWVVMLRKKKLSKVITGHDFIYDELSSGVLTG